MDADTDRLAGTIARPLRIHFYVDGFHAYLLSRQVAKLHRTWLHEILHHFPKATTLFETELSPDKQAQLVLRLLTFAEEIIIASGEKTLGRRGVDVIAKKDVDLARNRFSKNIFDSPRGERFEGRTFVEADSYGWVFCPQFSKSRLLEDIDEFKHTLLVDEDLYDLNLKQLAQMRKRVERGDFDATQKFYEALADKIGEVSDRGTLKLSFNVGRRPIEEKGVDGDFITALAFDAADDLAHVYVLLTNDSDHAPAAERLVERGKKVKVITYSDKPAAALRSAVGAGNVIDLLTNEREFDFDPVWLRTADSQSLRVLEDMRMQWSHWKSSGKPKR